MSCRPPTAAGPTLHRFRARASACAWACAWACATVAIVLAGLAPAGRALGAEAQDPNAVKAEMLGNMAKFVQWPDAMMAQNVYIAGSEIAHAPEVVEALRGTSTLTLADADGFATRGGMVDFAGTAPNFRFEICLVRAEQAGLKISSRLLALAHVVPAGS